MAVRRKRYRGTKRITELGASNKRTEVSRRKKNIEMQKYKEIIGVRWSYVEEG